MIKKSLLCLMFFSSVLSAFCLENETKCECTFFMFQDIYHSNRVFECHIEELKNGNFVCLTNDISNANMVYEEMLSTGKVVAVPYNNGEIFQTSTYNRITGIIQLASDELNTNEYQTDTINFTEWVIRTDSYTRLIESLPSFHSWIKDKSDLLSIYFL